MSVQLLTKNKDARIGNEKGVDEIISHPFFASINVKKLLSREVGVCACERGVRVDRAALLA